MCKAIAYVINVKLILVILIFILNVDLSATSLDGTSGIVYKSNHYVFRDRNSAQGMVCLDNGFTVLPATNHASNVFLDLNISVSGAIDLRGTSTVTLLHDLYLDKGVTFSDSGYIYGFGASLVMLGDLTIPASKVLHCGGNLAINGSGHTLFIDDSGQLFLDTAATVTLKNIVISTKKSYPGAPSIALGSNTSKLALDNVILSLGDDWYVNRGQLFIHNDVSVTGTSALVYSSPKSSFITSHGCLYFDLGTTFSYVPSCTSNDLIVMNDQSSTLVLNGCTLKTTHTGMRLAKGRLYLDNKIFLNSREDEIINSTTSATLTTSAFTGASSRPWGCSWSPDGKYIAVVTYQSNTLQVFSCYGTPPALVSSISTGTQPRSCCWSQDGKYIAVVHYENTGPLQVFSFLNQTLTQVGSNVSTGSYPMSCCWSPDGKYIAVANWSSSTFQIFEFTGATPVYSGGVSPGTNQTECSWSPDGKYVAVVLAGTSDSINVYSFSGGALTLNASASTANNPYSCSWSPDGRYLAVTSNNDNVLQVFSFSDGSVTQVGSNASTGGSSFPISCAWSPNGKYIALVNYSGDTLQIYEFSGGTPLKIGSNISTGSGSTPVSCCWSPNGRCLAVSCDATSVSLLEIFGVNYNANTYAQPMTNSIIWGNSTLGDSYNLDINVLSGARVEITGNVYHDVA